MALNEGLHSRRRCGEKLDESSWNRSDSTVGEPATAHDLLELLDRLNPTIAELSEAIEKEAEKSPEAQRLRTHPGVGPLAALAFVLIIGEAEHFQCGKQVASYLGLVPLETPAEIGTDWDTLPSKAVRSCASCWSSSPGHRAQPPRWRGEYLH